MTFEHDGKLSMNCVDLDIEEFQETLVATEALREYEAIEWERAAVRFQFNLAPMSDHDTTFIILSNRVRATVYRGPYRNELLITVDALLASDGGYDNLEFLTIHRSERKICRWTNTAGYPYWHANSVLQIDLNAIPKLDENGLVQQFNVVRQ